MWETLKFTLVVLLIVMPVRLFIAKPFIVSGASMVPTFQNHDYLIVDEVTYRWREPKRGEVIIFRYPKDTSKYFIKRIIGLPGETVIIENNQVTIQGPSGKEKITEPYLSETTADWPLVNLRSILGPDEYFVLGDNRQVSSDSRVWGALPSNLIAGRAFVRLYPLNEVEIFPGDYSLK